MIEATIQETAPEAVEFERVDGHQEFTDLGGTRFAEVDGVFTRIV